jgi:hypothetical protein
MEAAMSKPRFEELRERLLRAGIAPSRVHRYMRELREHYEDLYRAGRIQGLKPSAADLAARAKLGSDDALAESMLAQPELRNIAARYPALVFGAAPFLFWIAFETLAMLALQRVGMSYDDELRAQVPLDRAVRFVELYSLAFVRVLPVLVSAGVFWSALRSRSGAHWPIVGSTLMTVAAASIAVVVNDGQVGLFTSLLPDLRTPVLVGCGSLDLIALGESAARATSMLALTLVPYGLLLARRTFARS